MAKIRRIVFPLGVKIQQGQRVAPSRDQAIAIEVLRLSLVDGIPESDAENLVCDEWPKLYGTEIDIKAVQNAVKKWRGNHYTRARARSRLGVQASGLLGD